jgi:uncharacterized protein
MINKFIIDTNVLISYALAYHSSSGQAVRLAFNLGQVIYSKETFDELATKLSHKKFNRYIDEHDKLLFLQKYLSQAQRVEITTQITACRDIKDNKFLSLAVTSQANAIITGDKDLLVLHPFNEKIAILNPVDFLNQYSSN